MANIGLLIFRVMMGGMMLFGHGFEKLMNFGARSATFPALLGNSTVSLTAAVFAEVFCALAIVVGFGTRLASLPLIATMLVAAVVQHGNDPFAQKEKALLYLGSFILTFFAGAGSFSLDGFLNSDGFLRRR